MSTFKIYPIFLGAFEHPIGPSIAMHTGPNRMVPFGCMALRNNQTGEVTLLDTGYAPWEDVVKYDLPWKYYGTADRIYNFKEELEGAGIKIEDVKRICISHLHQDHCWNLELFDKSVPIYVQKKELERAVNPRPIEFKSYQKIDRPICPAWMRGFMSFKVIDGDYEIEPGLKALFTPGHTVGSQSFLIDTEDGQYIYIGDNYYVTENWEQEAMIGWYTSMDDWYNSHEKVKALGATLVGPHYPPTYNKKCYG